jgi:soluble lytic murein transglycosylase-like protein/tetratricopeptide (TPR) repeat protein
MKRLGAARRSAGVNVIDGSAAAIGLLLLFGGLLSAFSRPIAPAPQVAGLAEVGAALDTLERGRWDIVDAMLRGSMTDLRRISACRDRAVDTLSSALENTTLLRALPWDRRTRWLELSLSERREDWARPLLDAWAPSLPPRGDPFRGRAALAVGLVALTLADQDPEEGSAFLAGPPMRSIDSVTEEALKAAARENFRLRDEAMYRLAAMAESDGDTTAALEWADSLLLSTPESPRVPEARAVRARSLFAAGNYLQAAQEARLGLKETPSPELRWIAARALVRTGRAKEGARELETLILGQPADPLAVDAWRLRRDLAQAEPLVTLDTSTEISLLTALLNNPSSGAEGELQSLQERPGLPTGTREDVSLSLARYQFRKKRYDEALFRLQSLVTSANADLAKDALLVEARIHRNTGKLEPMETAYRSLIKARGDPGATAAWELAKEWESQARWKDAEKTYTELLAHFPDSARRRDAFFRRGFVRLQHGAMRSALTDFRSAGWLSRTPSDKEQAAFWTARTLWESGHRREALALARRTARPREPADAYGVFLRDRFSVPENARDRDGRAEPTVPRHLLGPEPVLPASPDVRDAYRDGLARLDLGLGDATRRAWRDMTVRYIRSPAVLQAFTFAATAYGLYPEGVQWAKLAEGATSAGDPMRDALERLVYPAAYAGHVVSEASSRDLDPAWIWSLMRQESFYDAGAVSRVGALGLMQVMPTTLAQMTADQGLAPLPPETLFRPSTNIAFGTRYFADRLADFDGHLLPTLASYNAGEGKCREWIERAGGDTEEVFLECIGYPETYDYVRRIYWITWLYHRLYPEGRSVG